MEEGCNIAAKAALDLAEKIGDGATTAAVNDQTAGVCTHP